ncbi:MAG TPA: 2-hydroxyacid dehydrogenase [Caulobacteraceae bacterium]|nr:2-hydroxyacid dehydrogenase [Caulobacteraceae bacterium]
MPYEKPKVLLATPILAFVEPRLREHYGVIRAWECDAGEVFRDARALVCLGHQPVETFIARCPDLGLIACYTTGYDGIDVGRVHERGLAVTHAPGATSYAVAEFALGLMLAAFRNLVVGDRMVRAGEWDAATPMIGRSLSGARLGVVGLGDIGVELARLADAMGMEVAWWGPRPKPDAKWPRAPSLTELATASDVLAVCARADETNRGLISAQVIEAVGPSGLIVNVARGQLIDEDALIAALRDGRLGGAALDVFEAEPTPASRWSGVPGMITTPHIGGATVQAASHMTRLLLENLACFFAGRPLPSPVLP